MENIVERTQAVLEKTGHLSHLIRTKKINIEACKKTQRVILTGKVTSYYLKQIAGHFAGLERDKMKADFDIANEIVVVEVVEQ